MLGRLTTIGHQEYLAMKEGATALESDLYGVKVLKLADGTMLKLFRRKRLLSSAAWSPYARRFVDNAGVLEQRGFAVPRVIAAMRIPSIHRDAVRYHPLPGVSLRSLIAQGLEPAAEKDLKARFTAFVIRLHDQGIYFHSLHMGNVILTPEGRLGLIDFSDLRAYSCRLPRFMRRRNLRRLLGIESERDWVDSDAILRVRSG